MTFPEFVQAVAVALAVVAIALSVTGVVVIALQFLGSVPLRRRLRCLVGRHGWITVSFGYFGDPDPHRKERTCGNCGRTENLL